MNFQKIAYKFSIIIAGLAILSLYNSFIIYSSKNKEKFRFLTKPINFLTFFPYQVKAVLTSDEIKAIPLTYTLIDSSFKEINNLEKDLFGINSFYNRENRSWEIWLFNLKNEEIIHKWVIDKKDYYKTYREYKNTIPQAMLISDDMSIILLMRQSNNLYKLDSNSNIIWHNRNKFFHHTMNFDIDSNLLVCSSEYQHVNVSTYGDRYYIDDFITKIDINTGEIIFDKSLTKILIDNDKANILFGYTNSTKNFYQSNNTLGLNDDPIHLNDIEPAFSDTKYWNKGDLFLSIRHRSCIVQYRPNTNQIIRVIEGGFFNQHDVDIISDSEIAIFNNNIIMFGELANLDFINRINKEQIIDLSTSVIVTYNFNSKSFVDILTDQFINERITTHSEGLFEFLSDRSIYIESQNQGKLYIINDTAVIYRNYFETSTKGYAERPHWMRIYESLNF